MKNLTTYISDLLHRVPWWANGVFGLVFIALGASLVLRPFDSLAVVLLLIAASLIIDGLHRVFTMYDTSLPALSAVTGGGLVVAGGLTALWPGMSVEVLTILIVVVLLFGGLSDLAGVIRRTAPHRFSSFFFGLSAIIFSFLSLLWPDLTLLVISILFGVRLAIFGLMEIAHGVEKMRHPKAKLRKRQPQSRLIWWIQAIGSVLLFASGLGLLFISYTVLHATPVPDNFYRYTGDIPEKPGVLLRVEPYSQTVPENADGWRILYSTTRHDGEPAVASAYVMAAKNRQEAPQPVIAWAHGTTGIAETCAPTVMPEPAPLSQAVASVPQAIDDGWVTVATDYVGLGTEGPHAYLVGEEEAYAVLDSVRAAQQMKELNLENRTAVWGHSQGGHSALWTGGAAKEYASELEIIGVAAASPASNLPELVREQEESFIGKMLGSYIISAYSEVYPDVDFNRYIDPRVQLIVREMGKRCVSDKTLEVSVIMTLAFGETMYRQDPTSGPFVERLKENIPTKHIEAPLFVAQGSQDELIEPRMQEEFVKERCQAGQQLEYKTYPHDSHLSIVDKSSPYPNDVLHWTNARLNGDQPASSCSSF